MGFLRLVIGLGDLIALLKDSNGKNPMLSAISTFSSAPSGDEDGRPDGFTSVVILSNKTRSEIIKELNNLSAKDRFPFEVKESLTELILNNNACQVIQESMYQARTLDFSWKTNKGFVLAEKYHLSLQGVVDSGFSFTHYPFLNDFLRDMKSDELIISDQYLVNHLNRENDPNVFGQFILRYLCGINKFLKTKMFRRVIMVFNSSRFSEMRQDAIRTAINHEKVNYPSDVFDNCSITLINFAESGKIGKRPVSVQGVFHSRQLFTEKFRIVFDTRVNPEMDLNTWNNTFELHPHYYDYNSFFLGSNQLRGIHLLKFLFYLKQVLDKAGASIDSKCLEEFNMVYPDPKSTLGKKYTTQLRFDNVQVITLPQVCK